MDQLKLVEDLAERFLELVSQGTGGNLEEFCREHPDLVSKVRSRIAELTNDSLFNTPPHSLAAKSTVDHATAEDEAVMPNAAAECPGMIGRYEIIGEIARGGMGAVLKARDLEFDRSLAIKITLAKHVGSEDARRRFLEEARITGRLQHPGIPPVHELGRFGTDRPFFAMKLIEGESLEKILTQRSDVSEDRTRLLNGFQTICDTVAYAHSKGIIHRDLKPHNIMIGEFGEVQVMDWGLAKSIDSATNSTDPVDSDADELADQANTPISDLEVEDTVEFQQTGQASSPTRFGTVLGTPSYMAPEQARGEIDRVDQQSDVFSLGAILCEILTGSPPFVGKSAKDIVVRAQSGDWSGAREQLDACGMDSALIQLTKRCLATKKSERIQTASELANSIRDYQEQVQARLRRVEVEKAQVEAKAEEETRRRKAERQRNRLWLSLVASVLVLSMAAAVGGMYVRNLRQEELRRELIQAQIGSTGLDRVQELRHDNRPNEARVALERTRSVIDETNRQDLRDRAQQETELLSLLGQIEHMKIRRATIIDGDMDFKTVAKEYRDMFSKAGFYFEGDNPETIAQRIGESEIADDLLGAIESWASVTRDDSELRTLLDVAQRVDPYGPRKILRDPEVWLNNEKRRKAIDQVAIEHWSPSLAMAFIAKSKGRNFELLRSMMLMHPDNYWLARLAGMYSSSRKKTEEAIGYYRAALALRPESAHDWLHLSLRLEDAGRRDEAFRCIQRSISLEPQEGRFQNGMARFYFRQNEWEKALEFSRRATELDPNDATFWADHSVALARSDKKKESLDAILKANELAPKSGEIRMMLGNHFLGFRRDHKTALKHYLEAMELGGKQIILQKNTGICYYRLGNHEAAIPHFETYLVKNPKDIAVLTWLGSCYLQKGEYEKSKARFVLAQSLVKADDPYRPEIKRLLKKIEDYTPKIDRSTQIIDGTATADGPKELVDLAMFNYNILHHRAAAYLFARAFESDPELTRIDAAQPYRVYAGVVAAHAGCRKGRDASDVTEDERLILIQMSYGWLSDQLNAIEKLLERNPPKRIKTLIRVDLRDIKSEKMLAGVRETEPLSRLSKEEQQDWIRFWKRLDKALDSIDD